MLPDDLRAEVANEVLDAFGVAATYTGEYDASKAITVRLQSDVEIVDDGAVSLVEFVIGINPADATPKRGHTITIDGTVYTLGRLLDKRGGLNRYEAS